ncbi:hypothetical protein [Roseovarius sp. D22-M7]|uniref:hypothetical protein n=1 Tax=Roseovarius sp. D22-M7 TaxID=3127116 RepID=UPI00300FA22F
MALESDRPVTLAEDGYDTHYAEKLWALIPEIYRHEDGLADTPGQLRALIEVVAAEMSVARRSVDRLWADTRVDEADDWALPYIAELVGARLPNPLNRAARRAAVQRVIHYRQRNGTRSLMEVLADDIADWDAVAREALKRLFRNHHDLDGPAPRGRITQSPQWGFADLRAARIGGIVDSAFDDLAHRPDFRRGRGLRGRYDVPKVNLHLYRLRTFALRDVTPVALDDTRWTLDPSGRDVPLFQRGGARNDACDLREEWEVRAPITCRLLNSARFAPTLESVPVGFETSLAPLFGTTFDHESDLRAQAVAHAPTITLVQNMTALLANSIRPDCAKAALLPDAAPETLGISLTLDGGDPLGPELLYGADLDTWGDELVLHDWASAFVDPARGRVLLADAGDTRLEHQLSYYATLLPIGAGAHPRPGLPADSTPITSTTPDWTGPRSGTERIGDSATYRPGIAAATIQVDAAWRLDAADTERPYVEIDLGTGDRLEIAPQADGATLDLDGIWLALRSVDRTTEELTLELSGVWSQVRLRHVTLDPGGTLAQLNGLPAITQPRIRLELTGTVEELLIDRCVTGPIIESVTVGNPASANRIRICDSIVVGGSAAPAIAVRSAELELVRCTVLGDIVAGRIHADHVLADGQFRIADAQNSCIRYSAAIANPTPPEIDGFECRFYDGALPPGLFVSRRFGDPHFAVLAQTAPDEIARGGESATEIGAHGAALVPIKHVDLIRKLDEFRPINVVVNPVFET